MIKPGVYPAAVTPFDAKGQIDILSVARLLAWFEAGGCTGAVLAGTNGEGPSLSPVEKRNLIRQAMPLRGKLDLILGIATSSSDEAVWLCKQAYKEGALAALLMAPYYFREASEEGIALWFEQILAESPLPILIYNFPQRTGVKISPELLQRLAKHDRMAGAKDSSGEEGNLAAYRDAIPGKALFVGNETLLVSALERGWSGTISGVGNVLPMWLSQICQEWHVARESAETKFTLLLPLIKELRSHPQPNLNKALLEMNSILSSANLRLPLQPIDRSTVEHVAEMILKVTGIRFRQSPAAV